jgi:hypothetical protein
MVVVIPSPTGEALRLAKQAAVTEPFALTPELIDLVTAIDGVVLDGTCYGIGVIVDGLASNKCTAARYNCGVRYAYQQADRVMRVKSETRW